MCSLAIGIYKLRSLRAASRRLGAFLPSFHLCGTDSGTKGRDSRLDLPVLSTTKDPRNTHRLRVPVYFQWTTPHFDRLTKRRGRLRHVDGLAILAPVLTSSIALRRIHLELSCFFCTMIIRRVSQMFEKPSCLGSLRLRLRAEPKAFDGPWCSSTCEPPPHPDRAALLHNPRSPIR